MQAFEQAARRRVPLAKVSVRRSGSRRGSGFRRRRLPAVVRRERIRGGHGFDRSALVGQGIPAGRGVSRRVLTPSIKVSLGLVSAAQRSCIAAWETNSRLIQPPVNLLVR